MQTTSDRCRASARKVGNCVPAVRRWACGTSLGLADAWLAGTRHLRARCVACRRAAHGPRPSGQRASRSQLLEDVTPADGVIRRAATMIKGLLAPIGAGVAQAATQESAAAARHVIKALGS